MKLLLVHGAGNRKEVWSDFIKHLPDDLEAVALDLPGHGENKEPYKKSIEEYAEWLCERAKDFKGSILVGHSMGGAIALVALASCPELFSAGVIVASGLRLKVNPKILEGLKTNFEETVRSVAPWTVAKSAPKEIVEKSASIFLSADPEVAVADFIACDQFSGEKYAEKISLPVLIVAGEMDVMTPLQLSEKMHEKISGSELRVIEGSGHMIQLEKPDLLAKEIADFVKRRGL